MKGCEAVGMFRFYPVFVSALVLILLQGVFADQMDVSKWETYRATTQPQFRMAFPGPVKDFESDTGHTYSGDFQPSEDLGLQVIVHATRRSQSAGEVEPAEVLQIFVDNAEGEVTSQRFVRDGQGFVLVYSTLERDEGLVVVSLHNVYFLGFNVYDVCYSVIAEQSVSEEQLTEAVEKGEAVMKLFQAG